MSLKSYDYLDSDADELLAKFPTCGDYIEELLEKYKKALNEGSVNIGDSSDEIRANFENDVRKHCSRLQKTSQHSQ